VALKWWQTTILWTMRVFLLVPFAFMFTEFWNAALGHPGALDNISTSGNDVLGTSALMFFMLMLAVTPVRTVTGWRWHQPLRREFGLAMWVIATTDLFLAILSTANRIPGGLITRFAGHGFLFFGTISTVIAPPAGHHGQPEGSEMAREALEDPPQAGLRDMGNYPHPSVPPLRVQQHRRRGASYLSAAGLLQNPVHP
jgi:hypothetical protein